MCDDEIILVFDLCTDTSFRGLEEMSALSKTVGESGGCLELKDYDMTVTIPRGALKKPVKITASVLCNTPVLGTEDDEILVTSGLRCSPYGLQFDHPVKLTFPHCAIFSKNSKLQVILYTYDDDNASKSSQGKIHESF